MIITPLQLPDITITSNLRVIVEEDFIVPTFMPWDKSTLFITVLFKVKLPSISSSSGGRLSKNKTLLASTSPLLLKVTVYVILSPKTTFFLFASFFTFIFTFFAYRILELLLLSPERGGRDGSTL